MSDDTDWRAGLPEALKDAPYLKDADTPEAFKEQLVNAAQWQGNSLRMPGPDAGDDDIAAFRSKVMEKIPDLMPVPSDDDGIEAILGKLGKPEAADSYRLPEGIEIEGDALGKLKSQAFALNLTQNQFEAQVAQMNGEATTANEAMTHAIEEGREILKGEWGNAFESRMADIATFLKNDPDTPESIVADMEAGRIPPEQMRWLHKLSQLGDESSEVARQENPSENMVPAEAEAQLVEVERRLLTGNNGRPMQPSDPAYAGLVAKRDKLMLQAFPDLQPELAQWQANG